MFQNSLTVHKINVPFDVGKVSKQKFLENWGLINALYRNLSSNNDDSVAGDDNKSVSYTSSKFTPKRTFEMAFSNDQKHKLSESQNFIKPIYSHQREPTVHYQNNQTFPITSQQTQQQAQLFPNVIQNQLQAQNAVIHQAAINHSNIQPSGVNGGSNSIYHHAALNQSAFGGFNFGMTNNSNVQNFNNQNLTFSRPQPLMNREVMSSQMTKNPTFEQPIANKCWSVGKLPPRESIGHYGAQSQ